MMIIVRGSREGTKAIYHNVLLGDACGTSHSSCVMSLNKHINQTRRLITQKVNLPYLELTVV